MDGLLGRSMLDVVTGPAVPDYSLLIMTVLTQANDLTSNNLRGIR